MAHQPAATGTSHHERGATAHDRTDVPDELNGQRPLDPRSAYDLKEAHALLHNLPDDVLKQIPVLATRTQLNEGALYVDLAHPEWGEIKGMNNMEAGPDNCYVAKADLDYELWNYLSGKTDTYRLGRFADETPVTEIPR
jgi:hypothetical protein